MRRGMSASAPQGESSSRNNVADDMGQRKSIPGLGQMSPAGSLSDESPSGALFGKMKRGHLVDDGRTSSSQSTLNLVNCILGAGVLGYPFCFRSCGLLLGTLLMLVSIAASRFSYDLMLYCTQISRKRTYEELAEQAIGKVGRQIVQLCTAALNLGCIVAYLNILADVFSAVAGTIIPPGAEPSRNVYITGVSLFGALPVALWVRDHATLATFMMASVGFVILFAVVVVIFALAPNPATAAAMNSVAMWQPEGLLVAFPVIVFSFTAHPYYLGIFNNLRGATFARMGRVTNLAMGLSAVMYWVVGVFGYMTFRNRTAGDLLRNFGAANVDGLRGAYERAIKLCYGLSILGSVPLVILPFYSLMAPLIGYSPEGGLAGKHMKRAGSGPDLDTDELSRQGGSLAVPSGGGCGPRTSSTKMARTASHEVDVVDLKLHADRDSGEGEDLEFGKHALVVMLVLGTSLATAIWVPNIEFIFGLTGATASVLLSYIIPAIAFIKLMDNNPELLGGGNFKVIPDAVKSQWLWRKRKAIGLLCFGIVSGITCTDAILGAVKQEAAVVHLAQQLVAHEVVVAETAKVQQKARAAVTAMSAVELAAKELGQANVSASGTFTKLQQAAAQLDTIAGAAANGSAGGHGGKSSQEWGIKSFMKEHKQHAAETKVFKAVELALTDIKDEVRRTAAGVNTVIAQLDAAIAQLSTGEGGGAAAGNATTACDGSPCPSPPSPSTSPAAVSSGTSARDRANDLALELGKALGAFSDVAGNVTAGKSLTQVRSTAMSTLVALNQTAAVLEHVSQAVEAAKKGNKHDDEIKKAAAVAMRLALNATATSALAMQLTGEALQRSATEEASELLSMLVKVSQDLEKTSLKGKIVKTKRLDTNTTATASAAATPGSASTPEAKTAADGATGVHTGGSAGGAAGTGGKVSEAETDAAAHVGSKSDTSATAGGLQNSTAPAKGAGVEAPAAAGSADRAAEAAGQLEQVIKDLNSKIAAASGNADTARAAAAAAAAATAATASAASGGSITSKVVVLDPGTTGTAGVTGSLAAGTSADATAAKTSKSGSKTTDSKTAVSGGHSDVSTGATGGLLPTNVSSATGGGLGGGLNVSGIAAALQDAVEVTKVKQDEALQEIQDSLTNTNAKVAERVVDILKDISENQKEASVKSNKAGGAASTSTGLGLEAALTGGGGEAAAAIAASGLIGGTTVSGSGDSSSATGAGNTLEDAFMGLVHKITDTSEKVADVEGPVVKVDSEGHLLQEGGDGDGIVGPTVTDAEIQQAAGAAAKGSSSDSSSSDEASIDAAALKHHRKLGLGWASSG